MVSLKSFDRIREYASVESSNFEFQISILFRSKCSITQITLSYIGSPFVCVVVVEYKLFIKEALMAKKNENYI